MATRAGCWQAIRDLVKSKSRISITDVMAALGVGKSTAHYHVKCMVQANELAEELVGKTLWITAGPALGKTSDADIDRYEGKAAARSPKKAGAPKEPAPAAEPGDDEEADDSANDAESEPESEDDGAIDIEGRMLDVGKKAGVIIPYAASAFKAIRGLFSSDDKDKPDDPPPKRARKEIVRADDDGPRPPASRDPGRTAGRGGHGGFTIFGECGPVKIKFNAPIIVKTYAGVTPGSANGSLPSAMAAQARLLPPPPDPEDPKPPEMEGAFNWGVLFGVLAFSAAAGLFYYRGLVVEQLRGVTRDVLLYGGLALFIAALAAIAVIKRKLHGPKALSGGLVGGVASLAFMLGFHLFGLDRWILGCLN